MAQILLINPKFEISFWGLETALPLMGKRANLPIAGLPLLAALTPEPHQVTLIDENVEPIDYDLCARADIVGLTGMSVQRFRMREILTELRFRNCFTIVGGPYVTVEEDYFTDLVEVIFIGEAEQTWPQFLEDWAEGRWESRYEQATKTDMSQVPTPRYDLIKNQHYAFGSIQFSRGCPFQCEFCDIIITFGRRPRIKPSSRILDELDAIYRTGMRTLFVVDDNLIGNKKAIKPILRDVADWQWQHGYSVSLFTEASLDLADDPELMELMVEANITFVFIGIETPNEEALRETKKLQNLRQGGSIVEKIHRIQEAGIGVWCGMILGFDSDDATIFSAQEEFLREARIAMAMTGMLSAIPKTPLYDRLAAEGRLDLADPPEYGTNVIPLQLSREELLSGYIQTMNQLYDPDNFFDRLDSLMIDGNLRIGQARARYWRTHPRPWICTQTRFLVQSLGLFLRLLTHVEDEKLRKIYRQRLIRYLRFRPDPGDALSYILHIAMHYHAYTLSQRMAMAQDQHELINSY